MSQRLFSRIYDCEVTHVRTEPTHNSFRYSYFTFCLDLDEVNRLKGFLFGPCWWNAFRFVPSDFIFGRNLNVSMKQAVQNYAREKGVEGIERIELVAHMRTLGYAFNPAAFYFCFGKEGDVVCAILEVTNTFHEKKAYLIPAQDALLIEGTQKKDFYVSPFVDLDAEFEMKFAPLTERLRVEINSTTKGKCTVRTVLTGNSVEWSDVALLKRLALYPLLPLQVLFKIHFQAFILFLKRVPYLRKNDRLDLQKGGLS